MVDPNIVDTYTAGKEGFIVALSEAIGVTQIIDSELTCPTGRPPEIPYGVLANMMMVNMCDDHYPLYLLDEYYEYKDLEGIFHYPISLDQINDDRFGGFLDQFYAAGCRKIFSQIAAKSVSLYGIQIKNINFDTTSKVMWGTYETSEGKTGVINIDFGHSKDKREDKKQIKYGIGCANGLIVDAIVLSGNKDDKTYNSDTIKRLDETLANLSVSKEDFYYIADSALFSKENLDLSAERKIKLITRMPDSTLIAKESIKEAINAFSDLSVITLKNTKGEAIYRILEKNCNYKGHDLKLCVCYSESLKATKGKTIVKAVAKEAENINKISKTLAKREFACEEDANIEIQKLKSKDFKKIIYHDLSFEIKPQELRKRGRPTKEESLSTKEYKYFIEIKAASNENSIEESLWESCCFVLCSNDTNISGENLLREYKTQDSVEKKFQQLKSPQFVNSIYLESPERIEAFSYLMLICMLMLSLAEYVVRRGLSQDNDQIIGPGKIKMKKPTQRSIYRIFHAVYIRVIRYPDKPWERSYACPLNNSLKKILHYLNIPENAFIRGSN